MHSRKERTNFLPEEKISAQTLIPSRSSTTPGGAQLDSYQVQNIRMSHNATSLPLICIELT